MKGLEAIELMKQGKMIKGGIWIYSMDSDGMIWLKTESQTGWIGAHMFNILANDYEEYIEPKTLTGWERVERREEYYFMNGLLEENCTQEGNFSSDGLLYENANYFSTKEKAEEIAFKQTLFRKLQRFSDENGGSEIDWNDSRQGKFSICYDYEDKELRVAVYAYMKNFGDVYFISSEIARKAIELFHDDLIKYFTHDWSGGNE